MGGGHSTQQMQFLQEGLVDLTECCQTFYLLFGRLYVLHSCCMDEAEADAAKLVSHNSALTRAPRQPFLMWRLHLRFTSKGVLAFSSLCCFCAHILCHLVLINSVLVCLQGK